MKTPEQIAADKRAKSLKLACIKSTKPNKVMPLVILPKRKELLPHWE